eukprot:gb/GECG01002488.1/.p1 GENE.gb/GECG01002488.1/~~gb/GECG01002488.1/.p1  ORF type:complete len:419 (+),score=51.68 gb/GECG01002488.1/:1-1257(+)
MADNFWTTEERRVYEHVRDKCSETFREPQGQLKYKYLVPSGPYNQLWDWDSVFTGIGLLEFGGAPYLAGSMKNFFHKTNTDTGVVKGCITPDKDSDTIYHAKPLLIQGAWIAAKHMGDTEQFFEFRSSMQALLRYWRNERRDHRTGLYVWYDQMESGADDLPISPIPSKHSEGWNEQEHGLAISSTDVMVFLIREFEAFAAFCASWSNSGRTANDKKSLEDDRANALQWASEAKQALMEGLWDVEEREFIAYNVKERKKVNNRVFLMALPLLLITNEDDAWNNFLKKNVENILSPLTGILAEDMLSRFGFRTTSSRDPTYNNAKIIVPYSNWRGPVWVIANVLVLYGISNTGRLSLCQHIAQSLVNTLAKDLEVRGSWHECYHAETGEGLEASGFLSWNTLSANLLRNLRNGHNCLQL